MLLNIRHQTDYIYASSTTHLVQRLHLWPCQYAAQKVMRWAIDAPGIENALTYVDGFGNRVHLVTAEAVGGAVTVVAGGQIETADAGGIVKGLAQTLPDAIFLRQTPSTAPSKAMRAAIAQYRAGRSVIEQAHAIMADIHARVAYEVGASHAYTTAAEAFADARGVCQDHAHILVGMARELNVPARYVTGYLVIGTGASSTASHAWAELLIPDLGWVGFDAANGQCPTDHYVRVAAGLDAASVTPIKGSRRGIGGVEEMTVAVSVEIAQQ